MRFALLGCDDDAWTIVKALAKTPDHKLVTAYECAQQRQRIEQLFPGAVTNDPWESLMLGGDVDAVIVASDWLSDGRADQLRKLVQESVPLLLVHPSCSAIMALELDMIRRDTKCPMVAYFPGANHPLAQRLCRELSTTAESDTGESETATPPQNEQASPADHLRQVILERVISKRDQDSVWRQLTRDVDLLRELLYDVQKVSATGATNASGEFVSLDVHLVGRNESSARWSLSPTVSTNPSSAAIAVLTAHSDRKTAVLSMPADDQAWTLVIDGQEQNAETLSTFTSATAAIEALADRITLARANPTTDTETRWLEICRDLEIVDAAERSLARGRTIELQTTTVTEQDTFKGIMAAGSCLLLMAVLAGLFLFAVLEGVRMTRQGGTADPESGSSILRLWPACLLTPLLIFLSLQLLQLVFPSKAKRDS